MADPVSTYRGDAGLGIGSNPQIPVPGDTNLKVINDSVRDMMLINHENNLRKFQQKVRDRDSLTQLIADNQVNPGNLEPQYLSKYNEGRDAAAKAFDKWRGNFNDHDGYRKYQEAITNLKEVVAHGGANTIELQKLRQQAAQEQLPSKKADILRHIKEQETQDFGEAVKPYQQFQDIREKTFNDFVEPIKSESRDPNNPAAVYDVSKIDYDSILRNSRNAYVQDLDKQEDIRQLYTKFSNYDQQQLPKTINAMNAQIDKYNQQNGFVKGKPGFVDPINAPVVNGKMVIKEFPADFAAKYALAKNEDFLTRTPKFDYKLLAAQTASEKNKIAAAKVGVENKKANAYVAHLKAATDKILSQSQTEGTDISGEYNTFIDNINPGGVTVSTAGKKTGKLDAIYMDEMPANFQYINGPIVDAKGKVTAGKLVPFSASNKDKGSRPYYIPKYVNPQTGEKLDLNSLPSDIEQGWQAAKANGISKPDYVKLLLKKGILELQLQGKNGIANYTSLAQSAKVMNNMASKKGQENIMNPPEEAPNEPEEAVQTDTNPDE